MWMQKLDGKFKLMEYFIIAIASKDSKRQYRIFSSEAQQRQGAEDIAKATQSQIGRRTNLFVITEPLIYNPKNGTFHEEIEGFIDSHLRSMSHGMVELK